MGEGGGGSELTKSYDGGTPAESTLNVHGDLAHTQS